jgi:hypothetical protein
MVTISPIQGTKQSGSIEPFDVSLEQQKTILNKFIADTKLHHDNGVPDGNYYLNLYRDKNTGVYVLIAKPVRGTHAATFYFNYDSSNPDKFIPGLDANKAPAVADYVQAENILSEYQKRLDAGDYLGGSAPYNSQLQLKPQTKEDLTQVIADCQKKIDQHSDVEKFPQWAKMIG